MEQKGQETRKSKQAKMLNRLMQALTSNQKKIKEEKES